MDVEVVVVEDVVSGGVCTYMLQQYASAMLVVVITITRYTRACSACSSTCTRCTRETGLEEAARVHAVVQVAVVGEDLLHARVRRDRDLAHELAPRLEQLELIRPAFAEPLDAVLVDPKLGPTYIVIQEDALRPEAAAGECEDKKRAEDGQKGGELNHVDHVEGPAAVLVDVTYEALRPAKLDVEEMAAVISQPSDTLVTHSCETH